MTTNNAQIFLKNFSNFEISKYIDPDSLRSIMVPLNNEKTDFSIANGGELFPIIMNAVPEDTSFKINASALKRDNNTVFLALSSAGTNLGSVIFSNGNLTTNYTQVFVSKQLALSGNIGEFIDMSLKFQK